MVHAFTIPAADSGDLRWFVACRAYHRTPDFIRAVQQDTLSTFAETIGVQLSAIKSFCSSKGVKGKQIFTRAAQGIVSS